MNDDGELLRRYARDGSEAAFTTLVERHLGLVFHAALRQCGGDVHQAHDVAQSVFADLARKAEKLAHHRLLVGWLYTSTRYAALEAVRGEARRRAREQKANAINEFVSESETPEIEWERLAPIIDDALHALAPRHREAVLLRFFEKLSFDEVGQRMGLSEDAARMHVHRAVEKMRSVFLKRGVQSTCAALGLVLTSQAGGVAPAGLATMVAGAALAGSGTASGVITTGIFGFMSITKIITVAAVVAALVAVVKYSASDVAHVGADQAAMREQLQTTQERLAAESLRADAADSDNAKLLDAIRATRPPLVESNPGSLWMYSDTLQNRGTATPREAFETFYWAQFKGDARAMAEIIVLPPAVQQEAEEILQRLPAATRSRFLDAQHFAASLLVGPTPGIKQTIEITKEEAGAASYPTGYSVADVYRLGAEATRDARYCTIASKMPLKNGQYAEPVALFENTSNGWLLVIPPTKFLTALWKRAEQKASGNASGKDE